MAGPWDKYRTGQSEGPWSRFQAAPAQEQPQPAPAQEMSLLDMAKNVGGRTARALVKGAAFPATMLADPLAAGINYATGQNNPLPSQMLDAEMDRLGLARPNGAVERIADSAAEALAGTGGMIKLGDYLASKAPNAIAAAVPGIRETIGAALAANPTVQAGSALGGSVAAGVGREAGAGPVAQTALALLGSYAGGRMAGMNAKPERVTSDQLRARAKPFYEEAGQSGAALTPEATDKFLERISAIQPTDEIARELGGNDFITSRQNAFERMRGTPTTLARANDIDKTLNNLLDSETVLGRPTADGRQILMARNALRDTIVGAGPQDIQGDAAAFALLEKGRDLWARQARLRDVEAIMQRAEMTDNPATAIRTGFRNLYNNPNRMRGFTQEEADLIKKAANSSATMDALRQIGSRLLTIGGAVKSGPIGAAAGYAVSTASRNAATNLAMNRAQRIADAIAGGAIPRPTQTNNLSILLGALPATAQARR